MIQEKHYRSLVKTISYRITGTLSTILISFLISGKWDVALSIGLAELVTKLGLYYAHERLWSRIPFGRIEANKGVDYNI